MQSLVIFLSLISRFSFKSGICLLIAPVPVHFFSITFTKYLGGIQFLFFFPYVCLCVCKLVFRQSFLKSIAIKSILRINFDHSASNNLIKK